MARTNQSALKSTSIIKAIQIYINILIYSLQQRLIANGSVIMVRWSFKRKKKQPIEMIDHQQLYSTRNTYIRDLHFTRSDQPSK